MTCAAVRSVTMRPLRNAYPGSSSTPATDARVPALVALAGVPAHEVADPYPGRGRSGGLERERSRQVARHVVVAERGQQHRAGLFRARAEFLEDLPDERRFTGRVEVHRARVHGGFHGGPADLHERARGRHEHVTGVD